MTAEPRLVMSYRGGAQILDAREHLIVRLPNQTSTELRNRLRCELWHRASDRDWQRKSNPASISSAITILTEAYGKPEQL